MRSDELARQGRLEEALLLVDRVIDKDPFSADAHFRKGLILAKQGVRAEALAEISSALSGDSRFFSLFGSLLVRDQNLTICRPLTLSFDKVSTMPRDDLILGFLAGCKVGNLAD